MRSAQGAARWSAQVMLGVSGAPAPSTRIRLCMAALKDTASTSAGAALLSCTQPAMAASTAWKICSGSCSAAPASGASSG